MVNSESEHDYYETMQPLSYSYLSVDIEPSTPCAKLHQTGNSWVWYDPMGNEVECQVRTDLTNIVIEWF